MKVPNGILNKIEDKVRKNQADETMKEVFKNTRLLQSLLDSYTFKKSTVKTFIVSTPATHISHRIYDWSSLLDNIIDELVLESDHVSILREPLISHVANNIQANLDKLSNEYAQVQ